MTKRVATILLAMAGFAHGAGAPASPMSKAEYDAAKRDVESDHRTAKIGCEPMPARVKDDCLADVNVRHAVTVAELEHAYAPGPRSKDELRIAKAWAAHAVARKKCDDKAGIPRQTCLKESEAAKPATRAAEGKNDMRVK